MSPLCADEALESVKRSRMFALSEPGKCEQVLVAAAFDAADGEIECPIVFDDVDATERAFMGQADPARIGNSGEAAVAEAVRRAIEPFIATDGRVVLSAWCRAVLAQG